MMLSSSASTTVTMADIPTHQPPPPPPHLISATAPGKLFASRIDLQNHYKSDWHKYNLRRRSSGLPMLNELDFAARLEAALALRREKEEREGKTGRNGVAHRKDKEGARLERQQQTTPKEEQRQQPRQRGKNRRRKTAFASERFGEEEESMALPNEHEEEAIITLDDDGKDNNEAALDANDDEKDIMEEEPPEINPCQSLFDKHVSSSPQDNLNYLQKNYSFYLPDSEYLVDLEGFLGYCNEKIRWGNICLYCQKTFKGGAQGVIRHMKDKEHCKILYERNVDMEEYDVFYDFSKMPGNCDAVGKKNKKAAGEDKEATVENGNGEDEEEWEDVSNDEDASMKDDGDEDDELFDAYQEEMSTRGFDITPLGELIFPDGRIVGHRALARYYKQRFAPDRMEREAVRHARVAAADRLHDGRVVNLYQLQKDGDDATSSTELTNATTVRRYHLPSGSIPIGRGGKGILVSSGGAGGGGFTSLSLYRYRAAIKKQRREDARGQRLQYRSRMNTNKMDKKGNNIATGVVTAMMPR